MVISIEDTISKESLMDRVVIYGQMELVTMVLFSRDSDKDRAYGSAKVEMNIEGTLVQTGKMDSGNSGGLTGITTKDGSVMM